VGGQYLLIRCSEQLAEAGTQPSVRSRGHSYDNVLAETIIGLYKPRSYTDAVRGGIWRPWNT
jgi:putative transposase